MDSWVYNKTFNFINYTQKHAFIDQENKVF